MTCLSVAFRRGSFVPKDQLQKVIELGRTVLAPDGSADIEDDIARFSEGTAAILKLLESGAFSRDESFEDLKVLSQVHEQVLALATVLRGGALDELKAFRQRGKAIMAYTDTLPKSVSISSNKKG